MSLSARTLPLSVAASHFLAVRSVGDLWGSLLPYVCTVAGGGCGITRPSSLIGGGARRLEGESQQQLNAAVSKWAEESAAALASTCTYGFVEGTPRKVRSALLVPTPLDVFGDACTAAPLRAERS